MSCGCGKPKCDGHCGVSPAVLQINNPSECTLFHRVEVPASLGDSKTNPPKNGAYKNVLLYYEADQTSWLYSSDGIPTRLTNGLTDYEDAINLPKINGVTLIGDKSSADLKLADAPMVITIASGNASWSGADTAEDIYNFFLNQGKVNVVFGDSENYGYEIVSAAYIPGEQKMMCMTTVASVDTGSSPVEFSGNALYGLMTFYTVDKAVDVGELDLQPKLSVTDFTGLELNDNILSGVPATSASIGMVKPGDGLEVASDGTLTVVDHVFDTVADMKQTTNLVDGGYARTLGFRAIGDGGGSFYKIKNHTTETINEMDVISLSGDLIAVFIPQENAIRPEQIGAYSDGSQDSIAYINRAIALNKRNVVMDGTYLISEPITITTQTNVNITGRGTVNCNSGYALVIDGCGWSSVENLRFNSPNGLKITGTTGAAQYLYMHNLRFNGNNTAGSVGLLAESPAYFCNDVTYEQCLFHGYGTGIYINSDGSHECTSHKFVRCSTEGCTLGQRLVNSSYDTFEMCRHVEAGSLKWKTEGTCSQLLIIGGLVSNNASGSVDFSTGTSGTIFGRVRMGDIYNTDASKAFSIVAGKIIPSENSCSEEYADLGSDNTLPSANYSTVYACGRCYNTATTTTTNLDTAYYGGRNKINNFMLRIGGGCHKIMQMGTKTFDIDNSTNPSDKLILFSWHPNAGWTVQSLATSYSA